MKYYTYLLHIYTLPVYQTFINMTRIKAYFHLLPVTDNSPYLIQFKDPNDLLKQLEYDYHVYVTIEETQLVKYNYHFTIDPSIKHQYELDALLIAKNYQALLQSYQDILSSIE